MTSRNRSFPIRVLQRNGVVCLGNGFYNRWPMSVTGTTGVRQFLEYREFVPSAPLRPFVECFWSVSTAGEFQHLVVPDGCIDIVYSKREGLRVAGAMTTADEFPLARGERVIGVRFHPGSAGLFLRVPVAELSDRVVALEDLWGKGARKLQELLAHAGDRDDLAGLSLALPIPEDGHSPVRAAIGAITRAGGRVDLPGIADQADLSPRQFRRRCLDETGLTPKQLCRVLRFRHALHLLDSARQCGWAELALECGYCDQAHFIHEFQAFSGYTPGEYGRRQHVRFLQSRPAPDA